MYTHPNNIENAESWSNTTYDEIPSICLVFWLHISIWKQHTVRVATVIMVIYTYLYLQINVIIDVLIDWTWLSG